VAYQEDVNAALQALRQREFEAGRYYPDVDLPEFPVTDKSPSPGAKHRSIKAALKASEAEGTCSILDLDRIGPRPDVFTAGALPDERLMQVFGTTHPSREMPDFEDKVQELWEDIDRGEGFYLVLYKDGAPHELYFGGYSFD